jgi:hypothetical protein
MDAAQSLPIHVSITGSKAQILRHKQILNAGRLVLLKLQYPSPLLWDNSSIQFFMLIKKTDGSYSTADHAK